WLASIMVMASCVAVLFGDKIRSQSKPFLYLFQLVAAKDPVHEYKHALFSNSWNSMIIPW
ncbi:hypothetical protein, partial [Klebsiella quasipneumoniae]|uniref:hypothetical protein n=1 Tax=Klebsiella quasipneumoniae TaxID=1463165 RepID=UPI003BF69890